MRVETILGADFDALCVRLAENVLEKNFSPNVVIGILTGGGYIGRKSYEEFKRQITDHEVIYTEVKLQRPSTKTKKQKKANELLPKLPQWLLNFLRIIEVYYYEIKVRFVKPRREGTLIIEDSVAKCIQQGGKKVLIIDDCIDTGYTLKLVKEYLQYNYPGNDFRIAVATVAHHFPVVIPEYQLYNRVLLRFPWANDVKKEKDEADSGC